MRSDSTSQESWSLLTRIAFRFGVIAGGFCSDPGSSACIPGAGRSCSRSIAPGIGSPHGSPRSCSGSSSRRSCSPAAAISSITMSSCCSSSILAVFGTLVWSLRTKRRSHRRLAAGATIAARYFLAIVMLGYGVAKSCPASSRRRGSVATTARSATCPRWAFCGRSWATRSRIRSSPVARKCLGAVLLLSRRLYVIGALVIAIVMTNVVALNFCYDVPVKLFSSELLIISILLVLPQARRIIAVLVGSRGPRSAATRPWIDRGRAIPPRREGDRRRACCRSRVRARSTMIRNFNRRR